MAYRFEKLSGVFKLLSEVELVFGLWSILLLILFSILQGPQFSYSYLVSLNFKEVLFVFVIMSIASTKAIVECAQLILAKFTTMIPLRFEFAFFVAALAIAPMLGSLITEPAAMAVSAIILSKGIFNKNISLNFKYAMLSLLFVNISIGGTLTHFAAPPILIVANKWGISSPLIFRHLGYKAILAIFLSTLMYLLFFRKELNQISIDKKIFNDRSSPIWLILVHLILLILSVVFAHQPWPLVAVFITFFVILKITPDHQAHYEIKDGLKVSFFMWGLIVIGGMQAWWLKSIISSLSESKMFFGATLLTAITDNAALTYLGSVSELSVNLRWALLSGAVAGGGLTIIANAPNPIGLAYLKDFFALRTVSMLEILKWSIIPTLISILCFMLLPNL